MLQRRDWFHYSVDYRIGTRYMGEHIVDNFKREAMRVPFLRDLLRSDSIYISSNITFENLEPLSTYLGKPGDPDKGGLSLRRVQAPPGPASRGRDQRPSRCAGFHRAVARHLRLSAFRLRFRRQPVRSGPIPTTPTIRCCAASPTTRCCSISKARPSHARMLVERFRKSPSPCITSRNSSTRNGRNTRSSSRSPTDDERRSRRLRGLGFRAAASPSHSALPGDRRAISAIR